MDRPKIPTTFLVAYMVDRLGRKIPLVSWTLLISRPNPRLTKQYIGSVFMLAGALFGGLSHSRAELIGARVLLGIGTAFARRSPTSASAVNRRKLTWQR